MKTHLVFLGPDVTKAYIMTMISPGEALLYLLPSPVMTQSDTRWGDGVHVVDTICLPITPPAPRTIQYLLLLDRRRIYPK